MQTTRRTFLSMAGAAVLRLQAPQPNPVAKWKPTDLIRPDELISKIRGNAESKPLIIFSGFPSNYRAGHIPGAILGGPASAIAGLDTLKRAVEKVSKSREIVVYCGCCPWQACPNVRPAFEALTELGYKQLRGLVIPSNLEVDWLNKGYPLEKGA